MKTWQKIKQQPKLLDRYLLRERVIAAIREFFKGQKYHEIEVPLLSPTLPAESYLEVFETQLLDRLRKPHRAFLTTSPEIFLKKLLAAGVRDCYTICKSFRNTETHSKTHNPEFTILEWYQVEADYLDVMRNVEKLIPFVLQKLRGSAKKPTITYQHQSIDFSSPWERISITQAFKRWAKMDLEAVLDLDSIRPVAIKRGYRIKKSDSWEELFNQMYLNEVEPRFPPNRPFIVYDYPAQLAALAAKKKADDPRFVERFEVYIAGIELADCCTELVDWREQQARFDREWRLRKRLGKTEYPLDTEFIEALKTGLPPCAGIALGVDRLLMLLADVPRIQDVLFFPADEMWRE